MGYAVFDHLTWIGVVDYMVVDRGLCTWNESLRSYFQPAIRHLQELVVDEQRGCRRCGG